MVCIKLKTGQEGTYYCIVLEAWKACEPAVAGCRHGARGRARHVHPRMQRPCFVCLACLACIVCLFVCLFACLLACVYARQWAWVVSMRGSTRPTEGPGSPGGKAAPYGAAYICIRI